MRLSCLRKISLSLLWPQGLYLRLNLSKRWKVLLSAWTSKRSTFRSYLFKQIWRDITKRTSQFTTHNSQQRVRMNLLSFWQKAKDSFITQLDPSSQTLLSGSDTSHLEISQPEKKKKKDTEIQSSRENARHIVLIPTIKGNTRKIH